ncbi:MAG: class I SAM-dependent methyltransferase [Myxococcales bacterium]|nr:class I SAM-dependent methyltransferase [Myxococcales bacterium]
MDAPIADEHCACLLCGTSEPGRVVGTRGRFGAEVTNVVCQSCALVYVNPRPSRAAMAEYYAREYRAHFDQGGVAYDQGGGRFVTPTDDAFDSEKEAWHQAQAQTAGLLAPLRPGVRVLEVGCRHGRTLTILRERFGIQPLGIEPDVGEAARASAAGVECFAGVLEDFDVGGLPVDVIQLFHVLEHLHDPLDALLRIRSWLAPEGRLLLEVPNVHQPYGSLEGNFFQNAHLTSFSIDTLTALLGRAGFRICHAFDQETLVVAATPLPLAADLPLPFTRELWVDAEHDPEWVFSRLRAYAELFDLERAVSSGDRSPAAVTRAACLLSGPCFPHFALDALARCVEALIARREAPSALRLAQALAAGPQPAEVVGAATHLAQELGLLLAQTDPRRARDEHP